MKKSGTSLGKRIITFIIALCMMIGLVPESLISAAPADSSTGAEVVSEAADVQFNAEWTSSSSFELDITPENSGTAYYVVQESGADALEKDAVLQNGTAISCEAGQTAQIAVENQTSSAKDISVVYEEASGTYLASIKLPSYEEQVSAEASASTADGEDEEVTPRATSGNVTVSADPNEWTVTEGYTSITPSTVTINNTTSNNVFVWVSGDLSNYSVDYNSGNAQYSTYDFVEVSSGSEAAFSIAPKTGLAAGTYSTDLTFSFASSAEKANAGTADSTSSLTYKITVEENETAGTVNFTYQWNSDSEIQIGATPTKTGKAYVLVKNEDEVAPTADEVKADGTVIDCRTADKEATATVSVSDSSAKKLYFVYV
ncbi:MAG: hypothetical protein ACOYBC_06130, partial [Bilifractor sp.]